MAGSLREKAGAALGRAKTWFTADKMPSFLKKAGAWVYGIAFEKGWKPFALLGALLVAAILLWTMAFDGVDYRKEPSAIVARSVDLYIETQNLDEFLKGVSSWKVWKEDFSNSGHEQWSQAQVDLAIMLGESVQGLGTRPLSWLTGTGKAAMAVSADEKTGAEDWALYLQLADPKSMLEEFRIQSELTLEQIRSEGGSGVYRLTGAGEGSLYFGLMNPWVVISSSDRPVLYALFESQRKPAHTLGGSGILPDWRGKTKARGLFNPSFLAEEDPEAYSRFFFLGEWLAKSSRVAYTLRFSGGDEVDVTMSAVTLAEDVSGGMLWAFLKVLFGLLGLILVALAAAVGLAMAGWGGWLKMLAARAGIVPAAGPEEATPSAAFAEDAGMETAAVIVGEETGAGSSRHEEPVAVESEVADDSLQTESQSKSGIGGEAVNGEGETTKP